MCYLFVLFLFIGTVYTSFILERDTHYTCVSASLQYSLLETVFQYIDISVIYCDCISSVYSYIYYKVTFFICVVGDEW